MEREQLEKDRDSKVIDLWLQCYTQEEIAKQFDLSQKTVSNIIDAFSKNGKTAEITKNFIPQLYNIWNFARNNTEAN